MIRLVCIHNVSMCWPTDSASYPWLQVAADENPAERDRPSPFFALPSCHTSQQLTHRAGYSLAAVSQHSIHLAAVMSPSICGTPWKVALTCIAHSLNSPTGSQRTGRSPRFTCLQHNQGLWWNHHNLAPHPSQEWIKTLPLDCRILRQVDSETRSR